MNQFLDNAEMQQLVTTFLTEADEFIEEMEAGLLALEENSTDTTLIDQVFRAAHSLKGSSMAVGLTQVGSFTHNLEALLLEVKEHRLSISPLVIGTLLKCNDHVKMMIEGLKKDLSALFDSTELLQEVTSFMTKKTKAPIPTNGFGFFDEEPEVKVSLALKADEDDEESGAHHATGDHQQSASPTARAKEQIKVSQDKIDKLVNNIDEIAILLTVLQEPLNQVTETKLQGTVKQLYKISKEVQDVSISLRMLPVKPVFQKLKRIVWAA